MSDGKLKTTVNMFKTQKPPTPKVKVSGKSLAMPLIVVAAAVLVFGGYGLVLMQGSSLDAQVATQQAISIGSIDVTGEGQDLQQQVEEYQWYDTQAAAAQAVLGSVVEFDSGIYASIDSVRPGNVTIEDLAVTDESVMINCVTTSNAPPADFAEALDTMGIFSSVGYSGFRDAGEGRYEFSLTCVLPTPFGGEAQ